jgi:hypothetical protein
MKKTVYLLAVCLLTMTLGASTPVKTKSATTAPKIIKVKNTTNFDIDEIYLSPVEEEDWGDDILDPDEVLEPGEVIEVEIDCGKWDVKLVAEDNSACEIAAVNVCAAAQWNIVANCN